VDFSSVFSAAVASAWASSFFGFGLRVCSAIVHLVSAGSAGNSTGGL
jgi:hypothetical protein